ncbi:hypothetical protein OG552_18185 [Streptomyces sp. NBC_01476]|uniref:hypothetical protein n=1 Tax=Streptomyces sp. NBC_01476 TaxID=2903881 RepID=UPI002E2F1A47|nr:hypothetical protein [Streptomyces sp. NBC_01476]
MLSAFYRRDLTLPGGLTGEQAAAARASVTGGVQTGSQLPGHVGRQVVELARYAFTDSFHTTTLIAAVVMALGAVVALFTLRNVPAVLTERPEETAGPMPVQAA